MSPTDVRPRVELWRTEQEFLAGRDPWNRICAQMPDGSVFLRHEWFDAAWEWVRADAQLYLIAVYLSDSLAGIAPLVLYPGKKGSPVRKLTFLAVPDTQVCDILAVPEHRSLVLGHVWSELRKRNDWDRLELTHLSPTAADELGALARDAGRPYAIHDQGNNPGVALRGTWEQYYGRRTRRLKKGNNLIANKLKKGGHRFQLDHLTPARLRELGETTAFLDDIVTISAHSWKRHTGLSLDFPGPRAFIERLSELALAQGWLSVWRLEIDGRALAMEYQLEYDGTIHALRSDYDDSAGELSPGTYLNWKMLEQLFESGYVRYLMGPGDNAYKLRWAEEFDPVMRIVMYANTARGRWQAWLDLRLRPLARHVRDRFQAIKKLHKEAS